MPSPFFNNIVNRVVNQVPSLMPPSGNGVNTPSPSAGDVVGGAADVVANLPSPLRRFGRQPRLGIPEFSPTGVLQGQPIGGTMPPDMGWGGGRNLWGGPSIIPRGASIEALLQMLFSQNRPASPSPMPPSGSFQPPMPSAIPGWLPPFQPSMPSFQPPMPSNVPTPSAPIIPSRGRPSAPGLQAPLPGGMPPSGVGGFGPGVGGLGPGFGSPAMNPYGPAAPGESNVFFPGGLPSIQFGPPAGGMQPSSPAMSPGRSDVLFPGGLQPISWSPPVPRTPDFQGTMDRLMQSMSDYY